MGTRLSALARDDGLGTAGGVVERGAAHAVECVHVVVRVQVVQNKLAGLGVTAARRKVQRRAAVVVGGAEVDAGVDEGLQLLDIAVARGTAQRVAVLLVDGGRAVLAQPLR